MNTMFKILMAGVSCLCILAASAEREGTDNAHTCQIALNQMVMNEIRVCNQNQSKCTEFCGDDHKDRDPVRYGYCIQGCRIAHTDCTEIVDSTIDKLSSKCN